ncbi:TerD family protein [Streptomyces sp. LP05-1]|uniref:TerD family protein n=1 Tax=Streptomyces pyxinae TaxID=2970734 RepID=A0ABT2CIW4_9ACTN|nr:TerD family protein [Streptomyces sp. LP05-1]MCS0637361.1 TerD family protein [Streptomyces sp. LP05-1]
MTVELVRGQNLALPHSRLAVGLTAAAPVVAVATLGDERGAVGDAASVLHPGAPALPGVELSGPSAAAPGPRFAVDLAVLPETVHRVAVVLALLPGGPAGFGAVRASSAAVTGPDGALVARYALAGLGAESAVVALEFYRRQGGWKLRAVGQGYAGGLPALFADQGLTGAAALAFAVLAAAPLVPPAGGPAVSVGAAAGAATGTDGRSPAGPGAEAAPPVPSGHPAGPGPGAPLQEDPAGPPAPVGRVDYTHPGRRGAVPAAPAPGPVPSGDAGGPAAPVAGDATGWTLEERLHNQVWGMFEDLARSTAAYRSAVEFAESRREQELDRVLSDPRGRTGPAADAARAAARDRHDELTGRAREAYDRDVAQLLAEAAVVEPALPAALAAWESPVWDGHRLPGQAPLAVRLGDLHLPERPDLRIPMLVRLPLERGLWVDAGRSASGIAALLDADQTRRAALDTAVAVAARLLATHPAGTFTVHAVDAAGAGAAALAPLTGAGVLAGPPGAGAGGVAAVLGRLVRRVELVRMAVSGGATDALPPDLDTAEQLLIVHDFPHGFDDRAVTWLRYLAEEGPEAGVYLVLVADRADARGYGPVLDPLWRSLLRITPAPDDHLADPWVQHAWTFQPALPPAGGAVLRRALALAAAGRRRPFPAPPAEPA